MDGFVYAALALIASLAGFTQGFAGFGSLLVALPILNLFMEMRVAVPVGCLMALALNAALVVRLRGNTQWRSLLFLLAMSLPGMVLGVVGLRGAPEPLLKGMLGLVMLYVCAGVFRSQEQLKPAGLGWGAAAGMAAGALGVSVGANGPPIVAWAVRQPWTREGFRATLTSYFFLAGLCIVLMQGKEGLIDAQILKLAAATLPGMLLGLWAGDACCGKISDTLFKRAVYGLLAAMGLSLLWQAGRAWL